MSPASTRPPPPSWPRTALSERSDLTMTAMQLGLVGLGKMGGNMRERIRRAGHTVIGYDRNPDLADVHSL
ncbi:NAD(P)-binding domain-containing protein, partial [Streptomyces aurantiacus]